MQHDERNGLIILIAFLLVSSVLCTLTTNGGQAVSNIFANMVSSVDDPHPAAVEAQYAPIRQQISTYFLIGTAADILALVTLVAIIVYTLRRRHLPLSWCILLFLAGAVASYLFVGAQNISSTILAIPPSPISSDARYAVMLGTGTLGLIGIVGAVFALIGIVLSVWVLIRRRRTA